MKNKVKNEEVIRFVWENDQEYMYRKNFCNIADDCADYFKRSDNIATQRKPNYRPILNGISMCNDKLTQMNVPSMYKNTHELVLKAYKCFIEGYNLLVDNVLTTEIINKAAYLINMGVNYTHIVSYENMQLYIEKGKMLNETN